MQPHAISLAEQKRRNPGRPEHGVLKYVALACGAWLVALGIECLLHKSPVSFWLSQQAYTFLQSHIALDRIPESPVVIVDLSHLRSTNSLSPIESVPGIFYRSTVDFTDRPALQLLVQKLARCDPSCIGIDVDFSPTSADGNDGRPAPGQIEFLDSCLNLKSPLGRSIPVYLGVMRTMHLKPEAWLDSKEYIPLAAAIARFRGRSSHMPFEIHANAEGTSISSLSKSCAEAWFKSHSRTAPQPPKWLLQSESTEHIEGLSEECWASAFPVDYYSTLPQIENSKVFAEHILLTDKQPADLHEKLRNKIVLIGDATRGESFDTVTVPDEPDPVPGIYMHACAATTLISKPLYEINTTAGFVISFLISAAIAFFVFKRQAKYAGDEKRILASELRLVVLFIILTCLGALAAVAWGHVLWLQVTSVWLFLLFEFGFKILAYWWR